MWTAAGHVEFTVRSPAPWTVGPWPSNAPSCTSGSRTAAASCSTRRSGGTPARWRRVSSTTGAAGSGCRPGPRWRCSTRPSRCAATTGDWGLRRKDVEGAWAHLCRRAIKNKDTVVFSHHLLAGCPAEGIALLVDQLPGCAVHVIVTVGSPDPRAAMFPDDYDLTSVVERWSAAVSRPERLHLVQVDPDRPTEAWHTFGKRHRHRHPRPRAADGTCAGNRSRRPATLACDRASVRAKRSAASDGGAAARPRSARAATTTAKPASGAERRRGCLRPKLAGVDG